MAEKGVGEQCRGESNPGLPTPRYSVLREFKLDGVKLDPEALSAPSDGLSFASKWNAERLCEHCWEKRVLRSGVQQSGLEKGG